MPSGRRSGSGTTTSCRCWTSERRGSGTIWSKPSSTPSRWTASFAMGRRSLPPAPPPLPPRSPTRSPTPTSAASSTAPSHPRPCAFTARPRRARCSRPLRPRRQRRASRTRRPSGSPAPATIRAATSSRSGSSSSRCSRGGASPRAATRRPETCSSTAMGRSCRSSPASRPRGYRAWWGERSAGRLPIGSRAWPRCGARSTHACAVSGSEAPRRSPRAPPPSRCGGIRSWWSTRRCGSRGAPVRRLREGGPRAPPGPAAAPAGAAPAEEASRPNAPAGETAASTKPEPVPHVAPRIVSHSPRRRDALRVTEGTALDFDVRASAEDPDAALAYVWFVDGRRVGRQRRFRFVTPPAATATTHAVGVEVSDDAGLKAPRLSWTVDVAPRMREVDVRGWLERLASAWERRDLATLQLYRIVTSEEDAQAIRKRLPRAKDHQVSIGVERIRTRAQYATVAFALTEFDARGRLVSTQRESYELEKQASGFVGLRAR